MKNRNEKGFALVLSLVLLLVMSLMGGALIVISSGDHQSNNYSDDYQQTFYVAETAIMEGENYLKNYFLGPWNSKSKKRDLSLRKLPDNQGGKSTGGSGFSGAMTLANYDKTFGSYKNTRDVCYNSFHDLDKKNLDNKGVVTAQSWNFGKLLRDSFKTNASKSEKEEAEDLYDYYYEFFIFRIGAVPFKGYGGSVKKTQSDAGQSGMAYRVYGCGLNMDSENMVVSLESTIVFPR